jgi:hypothetical protein
MEVFVHLSSNRVAKSAFTEQAELKPSIRFQRSVDDREIYHPPAHPRHLLGAVEPAGLLS